MPFPDICVDDREACPNEMPTLCFQQQTKGSQTVQIRDKNGNPYPLDPSLHAVCFVTRGEWLSNTNPLAVEVVISDPANSIITLDLTVADLPKAGIWLGEFLVYEKPVAVEESSSSSSSTDTTPGSQDVIYRFKCYLQSEENLTNLDMTTTGLTIAEIRLAIRDRCREDNFLLDNIEFSNTEIAWAIRRPIEYWNEIPPPLSPRYTPSTFPYRYHWVGAVIGELLQIASHNYERNRLQYAAANLSIDDKDKSSYYIQSSARYLAEYKQWVLQTKKSINMNLAFGSTSLSSFGNRYLTRDI